MAVAETGDLLSLPAKARGWLRVTSLLTVLSVFALVVLGGVVRVTESGLGCPDWPLCHGRLLPPLELTAIIEYTHRLVTSALVTPLVLLTCALAWLTRRHEGWLVVPATLAVGLLLAQAILGGVTVLTELPGGVVAAHLALGEALLACLVLVMVVVHRGALGRWPQGASQGASQGNPDPFPRLALISAVGVYLLILTGSYVTASGATAACFTWPLCQGELIPQHILPMIHMAHRYFAAIIGIIVLYTLYQGIVGSQRPPEVRWLSILVAAIFLAQVLVGAAAVWLQFPVSLIALHLAMATAVWGTMAALAVLSLTQPGAGTDLVPELAHAGAGP